MAHLQREPSGQAICLFGRRCNPHAPLSHWPLRERWIEPGGRAQHIGGPVGEVTGIQVEPQSPERCHSSSRTSHDGNLTADPRPPPVASKRGPDKFHSISTWIPSSLLASWWFGLLGARGRTRSNPQQTPARKIEKWTAKVSDQSKKFRATLPSMTGKGDGFHVAGGFLF